MSWIAQEARLIVRSRFSVVALVLLLVLSAASVCMGHREITRQREDIVRLAALHEQDVQALAKKYTKGGDAGYAAYYTFYNTWDPPSDTAYLALGLRDVSPYVLRIRALGLQAQLYEGETFNPELALTGGFDFSFVLIYLVPLFIIALLHDLVSGERESGRLRMLLAMPGRTARVWSLRAGLRLALVFVCTIAPVLALELVSSSAGVAMGSVLVVAAAYVACWGGLGMLIAATRGSSTAHAMALMGCWVVLTLVLPTLGNIAITRGVPVNQGVELMLKQRQNVHGAWDQPREATMQRFFQTHPEWKDTAALPAKFHWKWYYAFQQLGDESVAAEVDAYRSGLASRQQWTEWLGWLLPGVSAQTVLHRAAATDLPAQLIYHAQLEKFHRAMREFYYPYVFNEQPFGPEDFVKRPRFSAQAQERGVPTGLFLPLCAWSLGLAGLGAWALRRVQVT